MDMTKRIFSGFLALLLVVTIFPASWSFANEPSPNGYLKKLTNAPPESKIDKAVRTIFQEKNKASYLIKLKTQVDTQAIAQKTLRSLSKDVTPYQAKLLKRSAIVSSLRETANKTQQPLIELLNQEKKDGKVDSFLSFFIVNGLSITSTKEVMEKLAKFPEVEKVLPDNVRYPIESPKVFAPKAKTQSIEWNITQVNAPQTWSLGIDGTGTVVAGLDTGVEWTHPALKSKYRGYDPNNPNNPNHTFSWYDATAGNKVPYDDAGHGTHTMGTMVGSEGSNNQVGVAPGAKWIAVRGLSKNGGTDTDLIKGGQWIIAPTDAQGNPRPDMAPDVVNNSWGGGPGKDEFYRQVVQNWRAADIFPEFSAGNTTSSNPGGPGSVATPGNYPESYTTGATDSSNRLASFSLQGPSPYGEQKPDISAPGVNIRSSVPGGGYEGGWSGTSMAGPHVSAAIALLRQANASLTVDQLESILTSTAKPLTDSTFPTSPNNGYGAGLLDVLAAVKSVAQQDSGKVSGVVTAAGTGTPLRAGVTVVETNKSVQTDPTNGAFTLVHKPGNYTLRVEAYGYKAQEQNVTITTNGETTANFALVQVSQGTVSGKVTSQETGEPIPNVTVQLVEDASKTVQTDTNGAYKLSAYAGNYTLRFTASGYSTQEVKVNLVEDQNVTKDVTLSKVTEQPGEISYDNNVVGGASAYFTPNSGSAVKFTLASGKTSAKLTEGLFRFYGTNFPYPGGTSFAVSIYDATGSSGKPGKKIAGPFSGTALRNGKWTSVNLSDKNVQVPKDFYILYIQTKSYYESPGLAYDTGANKGRSLFFLSNTWVSSSENFMIRAKVVYKE